MPFTVTFDPTSVSKQAAIIPDVNQSRAGLATPEMLAAIATQSAASGVSYDNTASKLNATNVQEAIDALAGVENVALFVDAATGNDNNPGTLALPLATLQEASFRLPLGQKKNVQIFMAPGTYDTTGRPIFPFPMGGNRVQGTEGGNAVQIIGAFTDEVGTKTTTAADATEMTLTDAGAGLVPNAFIGAYVSITSGPNAGQRRMIAANSATAITVNTKLFPGTSVIGTDFIIEKPAVTILFDNLFFVQATVLCLKGLAFVPKVPGAGNRLGFGVYSSVQTEGIEIALGALDRFTIDVHSRFLGGTFSGFLNPDIFSPLRTPAGVFIHGIDGGGVPGIMEAFEYGMLSQTYAVLQQVAATYKEYSILELIDPVGYFVTLEASNNSQLVLTSGNPTPAPFFGSAAPGASVLQAMGQSLLTADNISISGSFGHAITLKHGSQGNFGLVAGAGNAGVGIAVQQDSGGMTDSQDLGTSFTGFDPGSGPTTVTGAFDTLIGGVPTTYAAINGAGLGGIATSAGGAPTNMLEQDSL